MPSEGDVRWRFADAVARGNVVFVVERGEQYLDGAWREKSEYRALRVPIEPRRLHPNGADESTDSDAPSETSAPRAGARDARGEKGPAPEADIEAPPGTKVCPICDGSGTRSTGTPCSACDGEGLVAVEEEDERDA